MTQTKSTKSNKKWLAAAMAAVIALAIILAGTFAWDFEEEGEGDYEFGIDHYLVKLIDTGSGTTNFKTSNPVARDIYVSSSTADAKVAAAKTAEETAAGGPIDYGNTWVRVNLTQELIVDGTTIGSALYLNAANAPFAGYIGLEMNTAKIMTVDAWVSAGCNTGSFWILDDDGWFYWAEPLVFGTATEKILTEIEKVKNPINNLTYDLKSKMQAIDEELVGLPTWTNVTPTSKIFPLFDAVVPTGVAITAGNFPDNAFRAAVASLLGVSEGATVPQADFDAVTTLDIRDKGITDLTGLDFFTGVEIFYLARNSITSLDLSALTALKELYALNIGLTSIDVSQNAALEILNCNTNPGLTSLDVTGNPALKTLFVLDSGLTSVDLTHNLALEQFNCSGSQMTAIDVSANTALKELNFANNQVTSLDVSTNTALTNLTCFSNQLTSLDVSTNTVLVGLNVRDNQVPTLDVSMTAIVLTGGLQVQNNGMTSLTLGSHQTVVGTNPAYTTVGNPSLTITRN